MSKKSVAPAKVIAIATETVEGAVTPLGFQDTGGPWQRVRIEGMIIECLIGVHEREHQAPQRVSIDVELVRREPDRPTDEKYSRVMCYERVINMVRAIAVEGHIKLVETFAERIAEACYVEYPAITALNVTVNKIDIFPDVAKVGVRLDRVFNPATK
jgi:7,8-dihydroneopterin aldolase/epimerase/oxygenase